MSIYKQLDLMVEHRSQFAFKGKRGTFPRPASQTQHTQVNTLTSKYLMV